MVNISDLKNITKKGLEILKKEEGLIEGVVYASANERTIGRIVYTSHLPSNGLEEPKSDMDFGVSVEIWFEKDGRKLVGMGQEANELSIDAVVRAIEKAKRDAVEDKEFSGFLKKKDLPKNAHTHSIKVSDLSEKEESELLVKMSWETLEGAVDEVQKYAKEKNLNPVDAAFILNGDNFLIKEKMALATTNGIEDFDETELTLSFITAMLERDNAKGSAWGATPGITKDFSGRKFGIHAALSAIRGVDSKRITSGKYKVVFGHQAVTELFGSLLSPHVNLGMVELGASIFNGKYGKQVASSALTLYDDATLKNAAGSKKVTDEGYPAGKTPLITDGKLVGYLSDSRTMNKMLLKNDDAKRVLGVDPNDIRDAIAPRNGFRFGRGGGRVAASPVGISATNLIIDSSKTVSEEKLLQEIEDGIFIGRLWYTYPIGGYASGIITGTAIADSYLIKDGKLAEPISPNTLRLEDNLGVMINNILGIADNKQPTINWASDEIVHAPWVAMDGVQFHAINEENE